MTRQHVLGAALALLVFTAGLELGAAWPHLTTCWVGPAIVGLGLTLYGLSRDGAGVKRKHADDSATWDDMKGDT